MVVLLAILSLLSGSLAGIAWFLHLHRGPRPARQVNVTFTVQVTMSGRVELAARQEVFAHHDAAISLAGTQAHLAIAPAGPVEPARSANDTSAEPAANTQSPMPHLTQQEWDLAIDRLAQDLAKNYPEGQAPPHETLREEAADLMLQYGGSGPVDTPMV